MEKKCCVEWCDNKVKSNTCEYCQKHYWQLWKHGKVFRTIYDEQEIVNKNDYSIIIIRDKNGEEIAQVKIDTEDVDKIKKYKWCRNSNGYIIGNFSRNKKILIHRYIMDVLEDTNVVVDHINHDILDNRKCNLRICSISENNMNSKMKNNKLGIRNISWVDKDNSYRCVITKDGKVYSKYSQDLEYLINWRDKKLKELHGEFAYIEDEQ